jgi:hypothetical protein
MATRERLLLWRFEGLLDVTWIGRCSVAGKFAAEKPWWEGSLALWIGMLCSGLPATAVLGEDAAIRSTMSVAQAIAAADRVAFSWQHDATLVGIYVKAAADGSLDMSHLAGKTDPAGDLATFYYMSTQANRNATIAIDRSANAVMAGAPTDIAAGERLLPITGPFLDLNRALAKVPQMGFHLPASRQKGYIEARLTAVADQAGRPAHYVWAISPIDLEGDVAVAYRPVKIDAGSGRQVAVGPQGGDMVPGLADELRQGKAFPEDVPVAFASFRHEADACIARWSGDFKLREVDLAGSYSGERFRTESAVFRYFRPNPRADAARPWLTASVWIDGRQVKADGLDRPVQNEGFSPQAAPNDISPPEEVMPKFAASQPDAPPQQFYLRLFCYGGDHWLWRMATVQRPSSPGTVAAAQPSVDFVYLDARSGRVLANSESGLLAALASPTTGGPIDPALLGTWQASAATPQGNWQITFEVRPTGSYTLAVAGAGNVAPPEAGFLQAGDGHWTETMSNGRIEQGRYALPDPETLVLTTQQGQSLTWKRAPAGQPENRAGAAVAGKPLSSGSHADRVDRPR